MAQTGKGRTPHLRVFLASMFQAVAHEPQEAALPAVSLTQHTLHCLLLRVKGNETGGQGSPTPACPTSPAFPLPTQIHCVALGKLLHLSEPSPSVKWE